VTSQVNALLRLQGPGFANLDATDSESISFVATPFDGTLEYAGTSGRNLGEREVPVSRTTTITDPAALALYTGTGTVTLSVTANGGNTVVGSSGGNLASVVTTEGAAEVEVIYHYTPEDCLVPGAYVIVQPNQPPGYLDGPETSGNQAPIPESAGTDEIPVTVTTDSPENNFGERLAASVGGFVYHDVNNNGRKNNGERGIGNVLITLTGTDVLGNSVRRTVRTNGAGAYRFTDLLAGTYIITERQPGGWIDGKDRAGTHNGRVLGNDKMTVTLAGGDHASNYLFGERLRQQGTNPGGPTPGPTPGPGPTPRPNPPPPPPGGATNPSKSDLLWSSYFGRR
jgi:hypothetical protein